MLLQVGGRVDGLVGAPRRPHLSTVPSLESPLSSGTGECMGKVSPPSIFWIRKNGILVFETESFDCTILLLAVGDCRRLS